MAKAGRPSIFNDIVKDQILRMYEHGLTNDQVAKIVGVSPATLKNWKKNNEEFLAALKDVKETADEAVVASLFQRATGYSCKAVKIFCTKDGEIVTHEYIHHHAPDTTACIFWLKNRQPDKWREKVDADLSGSEIKITIDKQDEKF